MKRWGLVTIAALLSLGCSSDGSDHTDIDTPEPRVPATAKATLVPEAGFVEVPANEVGPQFTSRLFYAFQPADSGAEKAPLLVFFNGGPGYATTALLWAYGTGAYTLDAAHAEDAPRPNADSYTRFANLLWIDARSTGFSYELGADVSCTVATEEERSLLDASDFVMTLLEFIDAHEALIDNPVVLVGESYGGTRAGNMLALLHHYAHARAKVTEGNFIDITENVPWLHDRVQTHYDRRFPEDAGRERSPDEVAEQFGWLVLIEPGLPEVEHRGASFGIPERPSFPHGAVDEYDVRLPAGSSDEMDAKTSVHLRNPADLAALLRLDPVRVPLFSPTTGRGEARRVWEREGARSSEPDLIASLGELSADDGYWQLYGMPCTGPNPMPDGRSFIVDWPSRVHTFMTNAKYDWVVDASELRDTLAAALKGTFDVASPEGAARPGVLRLRYEEHDIEMRIPEYEAGHSVTLTAGKELGEDVEEWLAHTGAR